MIKLRGLKCETTESVVLPDKRPQGQHENYQAILSCSFHSLIRKLQQYWYLQMHNSSIPFLNAFCPSFVFFINYSLPSFPSP